MRWWLFRNNIFRINIFSCNMKNSFAGFFFCGGVAQFVCCYWILLLLVHVKRRGFVRIPVAKCLLTFCSNFLLNALSLSRTYTRTHIQSAFYGLSLWQYSTQRRMYMHRGLIKNLHALLWNSWTIVLVGMVVFKWRSAPGFLWCLFPSRLASKHKFDVVAPAIVFYNSLAILLHNQNSNTKCKKREEKEKNQPKHKLKWEKKELTFHFLLSVAWFCLLVLCVCVPFWNLFDQNYFENFGSRINTFWIHRNRNYLLLVVVTKLLPTPIYLCFFQVFLLLLSNWLRSLISSTEWGEVSKCTLKYIIFPSFFQQTNSINSYDVIWLFFVLTTYVHSFGLDKDTLHSSVRLFSLSHCTALFRSLARSFINYICVPFVCCCLSHSQLILPNNFRHDIQSTLKLNKLLRKIAIRIRQKYQPNYASNNHLLWVPFWGMPCFIRCVRFRSRSVSFHSVSIFSFAIHSH